MVRTPLPSLNLDRPAISHGDRLTLLLAVLVLAWALIAVLLAVTGLFNWWIVVPIAVALFAFAMRLVPKASGNVDVWWFLAIGTATATVLVAGLHPGEHVLTGRDSGTHLATAAWLASESTLVVDARVKVFETIEGVEYSLPGFYEREAEPGILRPQFMHAYPALLATLIQVGGLDLAYWLNPVLAGLLILALHSLCRRLMRSWAALLATLTVATSLVFLYYARTPFTEVMMSSLILSGLTMMGIAEERSDNRLLALAGALLGGAVLTRIDGVVLLIPVTLYLLVRSHRDEGDGYRSARYAMFAVALFGIVESLAVSPEYILGRRENVAPPLAGVLVLLAVNDSLGKRIKQLWVRKLAPNIDRIYWVLVGLVGLALTYAWLVRPYVVAPAGNVDLSILQVREGLEVEPRSYAELSVHWLTWYHGAPFVVLAFSGAAILTRRAMRHDVQPPSWLVPLVLLTFSVLYLWRPSITPDHIWAMRRYLTVAIPLGALAGAAAIDFLVAHWRLPRWRTVLAGLSLSLALVGPSILASLPLWNAHELQGLSDDLETMCDDFDTRTNVLVIGYARAQLLVQSIRSYCNVPAAWVDVVSEVEIERIREQAATIEARLAVVRADREGVQYLDGDYERVEFTLSRRPSTMESYQLAVSVEG